MAQKKVWIGSVGPLLFDDANTYTDAVNHKGFRTEGVIQADGAPVDSNDVIRLADLDLSFDEVIERGRRYTFLMMS